MKQISKLHYITTSAQLTEQACKGGVNWIQLRLKDIDYAAHKAIALEVQKVCKQYGATFIINDNVALALDIQADGVHIGKEDMPAAEARALLGNDFIIGSTSNTLDDIIRLSQEPVDYIGLGPFRFTVTKQKLSPVLGWEGYRNIFNQLKSMAITVPPVVGIGGVDKADVPALLATGLQGLAISGAISNAPNVTGAAIAFVGLCNEAGINI